VTVELTYRSGVAGDGPAVALVFGAARAEMTYLPVLHTLDDHRRHFSDEVVGVDDVTVAVSAGVEIVGFSAVHDGWLAHLYVRPHWQGQGIGSALLQRVMQEHSTGLSLWVFEENRRAAALYARAGFTEVRRTDGRDNQEKVPDILMHWGGTGG
jgi:GNAT superfamily N-acetyltransferase